jgi:hypothetical protein
VRKIPSPRYGLCVRFGLQLGRGHCPLPYTDLYKEKYYAITTDISVGRAGDLGRLTLQLREFRVDGAQTPLTGHLPPPPHRVGAPKATGGVLQIGEPSMDGVRHEGPPAPPAWHGGSRPRCLQR